MRRIWISGLCFLAFAWGIGGCAPTKVAVAPARVAVVLGAGAAKGFAHVGVLKILEAQRVPIGMIVGTSAGSFVGSLYAYGYSAYQIQGMATLLEREDIGELTLPDNGFVKGQRLEAYVNRALQNTPIERLKIPFYAVSTNIVSGETVVFGQGNTGKAVRASCAVPGVYQPPRYGAVTYVDGGVTDPLAINVARRYGADLVIAVDVSGGLGSDLPRGTLETILKSVDIMYHKIATGQYPRADVIIRPEVGAIAGSDLSRRHEAILEGEKAASAAMPVIADLLQRLRQEGRLP